MRSTWSADRILGLVATASLDAGWLTLIYLAIQWLAHSEQLHLGIAELGLAAIAGVLLARRLRGRPRPVYVGVLVVASVIAAAIGIWLSVAPDLAGESVTLAMTTNPGGFLLGVAVLRGSMHADLDHSAGRAERLLDIGPLGLLVFWMFAGASGLAGSESFTATAYAATLTIVSASLLSLGLARLSELRVEGADRAARWRWLVLLVAVSGAVLAVGAPLAAILGVPVATAIAGVAGPLTPVLLVIVTIIAIPFGLIAELLHLLLPQTTGLSYPDLGPAASPGIGQTTNDAALGNPTGIDWMLWPLLGGLALLLLIWLGGMIRRPVIDDDLEGDDEIREGEPIGDLLPPHLPRPRLPWRRPRRVAPGSALDAYPLALPLLVGRPEARRSGETPRAHARRVATTPLGRTIARLAADYQLIAFAGRPLSRAEERRALERWGRVERASRTPPPRVEGRRTD
jgi:Domain of unknown function (DUF4129)